jgi:hypothetical protein
VRARTPRVLIRQPYPLKQTSKKTKTKQKTESSVCLFSYTFHLFRYLENCVLRRRATLSVFCCRFFFFCSPSFSLRLLLYRSLAAFVFASPSLLLFFVLAFFFCLFVTRMYRVRTHAFKLRRKKKTWNNTWVCQWNVLECVRVGGIRLLREKMYALARERGRW